MLALAHQAGIICGPPAQGRSVAHHGFRHAAHQQVGDAGAAMAAHDHEIHLVFPSPGGRFHRRRGQNGPRIWPESAQAGDQFLELTLGLALHLVGDLDGRHVQDLVAVEAVQLIHHVDQFELGLVGVWP